MDNAAAEGVAAKIAGDAGELAGCACGCHGAPGTAGGATPADSAPAAFASASGSASSADPAPARHASWPADRLTPRPRRCADEHLARVLAGEDTLLFDGAMGTQLQALGAKTGEIPELLNLTDPALITSVHRAYVEVGTEIVAANTFGANRLKLQGQASVDEIFAAAISCARASGVRYVAADLGPIGTLMEPLGTLSFDEAYELYAEQVRAATTHGADAFLVETIADLAEMKAAVLACREQSDLPVFATMTFGEDGRTFLGTTPEVAAVTLSALGVDVLGINCSLGPDDTLPLVKRMLPFASCPVMVKPNAGLPKMVGGATVYDITVEEFCGPVAQMLDAGVSVIGGCCGTNPAIIAGERALLDARGGVPTPRSPRFEGMAVCSAQELVTLEGREVAVVGERINPTGKKRLKEALRTGNHDYVMGEAIAQTQAGAQILDVNAGLPEIDEPAVLEQLVGELQGVTTLPLQIDSSDPAAIEAAVRSYPGKPIINSVNGTAESLAAVLPIAAHYGCALVGLTLDDGGIPETAEARYEVARRIVAAAEAHGIPRADLAIDCLAMAVSTNQAGAFEILDAIRRVRAGLPGVHCALGVSNVSFGLPFRELLNATFLTAAFEAGLDLPIMNPLSERYMDVVRSWRVLNCQDEGASAYIAQYAGRSDRKPAPAGRLAGSADAGASWGAAGQAGESASAAAGEAGSSGATAGGSTGAPASPEGRAHELILTGRRGPMADAVRELLATRDAMSVINEVLIPALDEVGERFERGTFFLPQLMASAEAAKVGFEVIRERAASSDDPDGAGATSKGAVAIATVKGDIHDIGKNIVKMLLENYGYQVYDLGRDVEPQTVVDCVVEHHLQLAGLSALMTTTVGAMGQTIELLRAQAPWCRVVVGGAVLNPEYAQMVGADYYAKDAASAARICAEVFA